MNSRDNTEPFLGLTFLHTSTFFCHLTYSLRYGGELASSWMTVLISAERLLTVVYPLKVARISTATIAKINILFVYVACFSLGAYPVWTMGLKSDRPEVSGFDQYCGVVKKGVYQIWSTVVLRFGSLIVPSTLVFIFTFRIVWHLNRKPEPERQENRKLRKRCCKRNIETQLTFMLIFVAITFLCLRLPYKITARMFSTRRDEQGRLLNPSLHVANKICNVFSTSNYASNFFLYCLCGSLFRSQFKRLLRCCKMENKFPFDDNRLSNKISSMFSSSSQKEEKAIMGEKLEMMPVAPIANL